MTADAEEWKFSLKANRFNRQYRLITRETLTKMASKAGVKLFIDKSVTGGFVRTIKGTVEGLEANLEVFANDFDKTFG